MTPIEYAALTDAPSRQFKAYIEIYLIPGQPPLVVDENNIQSFDLLEEVQYDKENPLGGVSSNTFNFSLIDTEGLFNPGNNLSPYKDKLIPRVKVCPFLGIMDDEEVVYEALGTYFVAEWKFQTGFPIVNVPCYDRLYYEGQTFLPETRVMNQITLEALFIKVFQLGGIPTEDYIINLGEVIHLKYAWLEEGNLLNLLQFLAESCGAYVYVDRNNKYIVGSVKSNTPIFTITESDQIIDYKNPATFQSMYSGVEMLLYSPEPSENQELLKLQETILTPSITPFKDYSFSKTPVVKVNSIHIEGTQTARVIQCLSGNSRITFQVQSSATEVVDATVFGQYIIPNNKIVLLKDVATELLIGENLLKVKNYLIQDPIHATNYQQTLLDSCLNPARKVFITIRGNAQIKIDQCLAVRNTMQKVPLHNIWTTRVRIFYDGGLSMELEGVKI